MKILERAVHAMVYSYLQENQLHVIHQVVRISSVVFYQHVSVIDIINKLSENIDEGKLTGMAFLDLTKAFDTLDHNTMLMKLTSMGFDDSAVIWFRAYLTNISQSVKVNGVVSDPQPIQFGVRQGSY